MIADAPGDCTSFENGSVAKVSPGGVVSTFVSGLGNSTGGLAFDSAGNLFIAHSATDRILKVAAGQSTATVFVAANQGLDSPRSIAIDASGVMYVSSNLNDKIFETTPAGVLQRLR